MSSRRAQLASILGLGFGVAVTVGNTIGTGILRTPGEIAQRVPSVAVYFALWIGGALYALLGANVLAELASRYPRSGGQYVYARAVLGEYFGFLVGWTDWISTCGAGTAAALVIGESIFALTGSVNVRTTAVAVVLAITILQWRGTRTAGRAQQFVTALKGLVLLVLIALCFVHPSDHPFASSSTAQVLSFSAIVVALQSIIYTYDGWNGIIYFTEEVRESRNVARSMFVSLGSVALLYLLLNAGFLHILPLQGVAKSDLVIATVAEKLFGPWGDRVVRIIMIATLLSAATAFQMMATRVAFGLSRDRLFSRRFEVVNEGGTPLAAHVATAIITILFILVPALSSLLGMLAFFFVVGYLFSSLSLLLARRREPHVDGYRARLHPFSTLLAFLCSAAFLAGAIYADPRNSLGAVAIVAASVPMYVLTRRAALR